MEYDLSILIKYFFDNKIEEVFNLLQKFIVQ